MDVFAKLGTDDFVVTRIDNAPAGAQPEGAPVLTPTYWIVNQFGNGLIITDLTFNLGPGAIGPADQAAPGSLLLFSRGSNEEGDWADGGAIGATPGAVSFSGIGGFSQYIIGTTGDSPLVSDLVRGDVDGDDAVVILDMVRLVRFIVGLDTPPASGTDTFFRSDFNGDETLDVVDVIGIANRILNITSKPVLQAPSTPVTISLDRVMTMQDGGPAIPVSVRSDQMVAGLQMTLTFDPAKLAVGTPQLPGRSAGMTLQSHTDDGQIRLVLFSPDGYGITAGDGHILFIPVRILNGTPAVTMSQVVLADRQAQAISVIPGNAAVQVTGKSTPTDFTLGKASPNPFNPATQITYEVPQQAHIILAVYNLLGQEVIRLVDQVQAPGRYRAVWRGRSAEGQDMASGIYVYRLITSTGFTAAGRMTLLQ